MTVEHAAPVAGFLVRPEDPNHGNYPGSFIWTGKFVGHEGKVDQIIEAIKENLPHIEQSEQETISFLILRGITHPDTVYIWERYTSEEAFKNIHQQSDGYKKMRQKNEANAKSREMNGYYEVMGFLTKQGGII